MAYDTEAIELREQGIRSKILVLSAWQREHLTACIRHRIRLVVWDLDSAKQVAAAARQCGTKALIHLKLDTGTTRIGTRPEEFPALYRYASHQPSLSIEGIFSHYADSEAQRVRTARIQRTRYMDVTAPLAAPLRHLACTAASIRLPLAPTNMVRLGIGLYGLWPSEATRHAGGRTIHLQPALSWYTRVLQIKRVPAGTRVGYDGTYATARPTHIGIVPIGYGDGYSRRASNRSSVAIGGSSYPVVGRVSMNLTTVDLGPRLRVRRGDIVTLIGRTITANDLARQWGTINYEVVTRIDRALPRMYTN